MHRNIKLAVSALVVLCLTPAMARAEKKTIRGRTGLPLVRAGGGNVWMEHGNVNISVSGNTTTVTQDFRLSYPGPPLETGPQKITVEVREDYFRSIDNDAPKVSKGEAKGFSSFAVTVDGRQVNARTGAWMLNDKEDTATRWRSWDINFRPKQVHRMRIVTRAPLGQQENRKYIEFRSKDVADWREAPALLEIRFRAPGKLESRLGGVEPKPNDVNPRAIRWVYRKSRPRRDIFVQLPPGYSR